MSSITTIFRVLVMLAVGVVVIKAWRLYGPTTEQVKSAAVSAVEFAESTWKGQQPTGEKASPAADTRGAAPRFANTTQPAGTGSGPPPATLTQSNTINGTMNAMPNVPIPATLAPANPPAEQPPKSVATNDDRVPALLSRLEKLGGAQPKLAEWGSSGHLYRFCCQAALADSPTCARHFESVAPEPAMAVEQVVTKVEAWRTAQRDVANLRY